jgi:hypothetical protein
MKYSNLIGAALVLALIVACNMDWVHIDGGRLTVSGLKATGTNFGKPGMINLIAGSIAGILFLTPFLWAKRINLFFCAFNLAWAIRNYIIVTMCREGDCPEKQTGIYLLMISSLLMLLVSFIPELKINQEEKDRQV